MDFNEVIKTRRSIRKYQGGVKEEDLKEIISCAQLAPSWKNSQTARFYAIVSEAKKAEFRKECLPEGNALKTENADIIVTTFIKSISGFKNDGDAANECGQGWGYYDLGCASENLCLKAREMGYGTLIIGFRYGDKIRSFLSIPDDEEIVAVIAIGKPDMSPEQPPRNSVNDVLKII